MANEPFQQKVVIVTGASSGIGTALAEQLAAQGAWLALAARDAARLETVAAHCREKGAKALVVPTDVADKAQCEALVAATVAEFGRIDVLINNAGVSMWSRFDELQDPAL